MGVGVISAERGSKEGVGLEEVDGEIEAELPAPPWLAWGIRRPAV